MKFKYFQKQMKEIKKEEEWMSENHATFLLSTTVDQWILNRLWMIEWNKNETEKNHNIYL